MAIPRDHPRLGDIVARNAAVKEARGLGIDTAGFAAFRRSLRNIGKEIDKDLRKDLREAVGPVLARARQLAPQDSGDLVKSLRISVQARGVAINSRLPYANVIHWGGSVGPGHTEGDPWSGSVFIRPSLFLSKALEENEDEIVDAIGDAVQRAARRAGWH